MSTRVGLLSLGSTTDGSISHTQHPTPPARCCCVQVHTTPQVVSRTRAWASSNLASDETFQSLKYLMIPADKTLCIYLNAEHERMPPSCDRMMMLEAACEAVPDTRCPAPAPPPLPGRRLQRLPTPELCDQRRRCEHRANSRVRTLDT